MKFHTQKQIGKSHVIDIFTSEDMENISLCIFQYLTLYYIINILIGFPKEFDEFGNCLLVKLKGQCHGSTTHPKYARTANN